MSITLQTEGRRTYLAGNTYQHKDAIRAIGAHWDAYRKMWWTAKRTEAEALAAKLASVPQSVPDAAQSGGSKAPRDGIDSIVAGRCEYKGKTYYLAGRVQRGHTHYDDNVTGVQTRDGQKILLYFRDGSSQFWADVAAVQTTKRYDRPQTISGLKHFAEQAKRDEADGVDNSWRGNGCSECRRIGYWCKSCAFDEFDN